MSPFGMAFVSKIAADGRHGDGGQDQRRNHGPDDLDRRVAVHLPGLRIIGLAPEAEDGVEQRPLDQDKHPERPVERRGLDVIADLAEVRERPKRRLGIVIGAASARDEHQEGEHESHPAQQPEGADPKVHYAAILLARIDVHTAG